MDIFGTTVTVLEEIYNITVFVKGVVDDVKAYDTETDEIRKKLGHEFVFIEAFQSMFFDDAAASESYKQQPKPLQESVKAILDQLKKALAEYGMEAAKHGILIGNADKDKDTTDKKAEKPEKEVLGRVQKFIQRVKDLKLKAFDWSLFEKAKILKMLETYSEWTNKLRQSMTLMMEKMLLKGLKNFGEFAKSKQAEDLGLQDVATRRSLIQTAPDDDFTSLDGSIIEGSERAIATNVMVAQFHPSWSPKSAKPKEVVIEHRIYDRALRQAIKAGDAEKVVKLKTPLRHLAWLLHKSPLPQNTDVDVVAAAKNTTLLTLRCIGYIDEPGQNQMKFIYEPPHKGPLPEKLSITTLHGLITGSEPSVPIAELQFLDLWQSSWTGQGQKRISGSTNKPSLPHRFFLAHALAATVLTIYGSGWVHKNLWSHGIIVISSTRPSQHQHSASASQLLVPYVAGWGVARPSDASETDMKADYSLEGNLYRHPLRQQHPSIKYTFIHDIYSLGVLLMEIGLWNTVSNIFRDQIEWATRKEEPLKVKTLQWAWEDSLKTEVQKEMGEVYAEAVEHCLMSSFGVDKGDASETSLAVAFATLVVDATRPGLTL